MKALNKFGHWLFLLLPLFLVFSTKAVCAQIEPHPACPSGQACYLTRVINQHTCTTCPKAWLCTGNPSRACYNALHGTGDNSLCLGQGPCRYMCIPGRENEGGCVAFSATVPCNTAGVCRTTIKFTSCTYDTGSGACAVNPVEYMGCCGPGSGTPTGTAPPTPTPSCTVDLLPATAPPSVGSAVTLTASVTIGSGTVDSVNFVSTDTGIATVNPASDSTAVYSTQATGVANGTTTVTANVIMGGASRCSDTASVEVWAAGPWWQVRDADVTSGGDVVSPIPATCSLPVCDPVLNLQGTG